jgi:hypothetical protein
MGQWRRVRPSSGFEVQVSCMWTLVTHTCGPMGHTWMPSVTLFVNIEHPFFIMMSLLYSISPCILHPLSTLRMRYPQSKTLHIEIIQLSILQGKKIYTEPGGGGGMGRLKAMQRQPLTILQVNILVYIHASFLFTKKHGGSVFSSLTVQRREPEHGVGRRRETSKDNRGAVMTVKMIHQDRARKQECHIVDRAARNGKTPWR